ncbi:hypothetical protein [Roseivirga pacifica]|uniref:hypothetical protein n=1 Tax=Roseivirga pacifica TaxID=1267423 RepID=UPI00209519C0|nr:hypothetical protein [Roseivirga pacifica]MCO6360245.1 hypothetical protein [Roseivirga pacifica]MCO6367616.1 hypothetical protein [Roseivirga pacifica]MCO6369852.1 hypothetical protein [Roseivirga pacifica]MCO6375273.1 hypothetical protein [Roseivirga pacifica]MCO6380531.1 hypothetical protein [Roseivirga pacifica]
MSRLTLLTSLLFIFFFQGVQAQIVSEDEEIERQLLASTKQLNQFFNRFNGEEDTKGRKFEPDDRQYRSERIRKRYLSILFDEENAEFSEDLLKTFIEQVTDKNNPQFLSLRSPEWFAVVNTTFKYKGKEEPLTLYMQIQQEGLGYEWVISDLVFEPYNTLFDKQRGETKEFLHPMSHELDFMNLRKALVKGGSPESYTLADFKPDLLTVFLYEVKMGLLEFQTVNRLNFHFFSIDGWYFQLNNFNRPGYNTGWLISDLAQVNDSQKEALLKIIYDKK